MRQLHIRFPHGWKTLSNLTKDRQNELAAYWLHSGFSVKFTADLSLTRINSYESTGV